MSGIERKEKPIRKKIYASLSRQVIGNMLPGTPDTPPPSRLWNEGQKFQRTLTPFLISLMRFFKSSALRLAMLVRRPRVFEHSIERKLPKRPVR